MSPLATLDVPSLKGRFRGAWRRRRTVRALYAFEAFRSELLRRDPRPVLRELCVEVLELLGRRLIVGSAVDDDIEERLAALDRHLRGGVSRGHHAGRACP